MEKQVIEIFSYKLLEPGTFISDLLMAFACYYFYNSIKKVAMNKSHNQFMYFFLFMGFSSFVGAFAHSLFLYTGKALHYISWLLTGISVFFIEFGISSHIKSEKKRSIFLLSIKSKLLIFFIIVSLYMDFLFVKIDTAIGLLGIVFPILLYHLIKFEKTNYVFSLIGILLALFPAFLHRTKFEVAGIFNMNDLSHFFLIFCLFLVYIGLKSGITSAQYDVNEQFAVKLNI
jgi:hypothetical protein